MGTYLGSERVILNMPKERDSGILGTIIDRTISEYENPFVSEIGTYAFANCSDLNSVSLSQATTIGSYAFLHCYVLASVNLPQVTTIESYAFYHCSSLTSVNLPLVTTIGNYAFAYCDALTSVNLPQATTIGSDAFYSCTSLALINLPKVATIKNYAFYYCYNLLSLYLLGGSIPILSEGIFSSTPIDGYTTSTGGVYGSIYVLASLYSDYLIASGWSTYSERIVSIGD